MENTIEEGKRKFTSTRTILVHPNLHRELNIMKIDQNFSNVGEVVELLFRSHKKLQILELNEKSKKRKNGKN